MQLAKDYALFQLKNNWSPYSMPKHFTAKPAEYIGCSFIRKRNLEIDALCWCWWSAGILQRSLLKDELLWRMARSSYSLGGSTFGLFSGRDADHWSTVSRYNTLIAAVRNAGQRINWIQFGLILYMAMFSTGLNSRQLPMRIVKAAGSRALLKI